MEYSTLIGKSVLSSSGKELGYVLAVYLREDFSSLLCLKCADEEEEEFFLPARAIKLSGDAILAGKPRLKTPSGVPCPVGKRVFDEYGGFLGRASALTDGEKGILTVSGIFAEREFYASQIKAEKNVLVFYAPRAERPKRKKPESSPTSPEEGNNLLGKSVKREVEGLCAEGETVTREMIRRARERNRLLELTANVLTE